MRAAGVAFGILLLLLLGLVPAGQAGLRILSVEAPDEEMVPQSEDDEVSLVIEADCSSVVARRSPAGAFTQTEYELVVERPPEVSLVGPMRAPLPSDLCTTVAGTGQVTLTLGIYLLASAPARQDLPLAFTVRLLGDPPVPDEAEDTAEAVVRAKPILRSDVEVANSVQSCVCERLNYTVTVRNQGNMDLEYTVRMLSGAEGLEPVLPAPFTVPRAGLDEAAPSDTVVVSLLVPDEPAVVTFVLEGRAVGTEDLAAAPMEFNVLAKRDENRYGKDLEGTPAPGAGLVAALLIVAVLVARRRGPI
jgi:hypothetical protein